MTDSYLVSSQLKVFLLKSFLNLSILKSTESVDIDVTIDEFLSREARIFSEPSPKIVIGLLFIISMKKFTKVAPGPTAVTRNVFVFPPKKSHEKFIFLSIQFILKLFI